MFANASLAKRIERAETGQIIEGARAAARRVPADRLLVKEASGGAGVFIEAGSPFNKVTGLGFDGVPPPEFFETLEREFAARQAPLQFEVCSLADPAIVRTLTERAYRLVGFENVLGLQIDGVQPTSADMRGDVAVTRASESESAVWMDTVATGFLHPDVFDGPPGHEGEIPRDVLERIFGDTAAAPSFERYLARIDGVIAGGASFRVQDGVAQLSGAATLPTHRRRGVQSALLRTRLAEAARRGCDVAVVTTQPGSKSQANAHRAGFSLLYVRAILVRQPLQGGKDEREKGEGKN